MKKGISEQNAPSGPAAGPGRVPRERSWRPPGLLQLRDLLLWVWASCAPVSLQGFLLVETWGAQCQGLSAVWGTECQQP